MTISRRAQFRFVERTPERVIIEDVGPWDRFPTVTNDAEAVVDQLVADEVLGPGQRLFYFDSEGTMDEIVVKAGRFAGFRPATKEKP